MNFNNVKAIAVDIKVNTDLLTNELLSIPESKWSCNTDQYSGHYWKNIFLTKNNIKEFNDFKTAKSIKHNNWFWDDSLNIPYIRSLVESLPLNHIGMIRAFILDGPLVMHTDSNEKTPDDISYKFGLTIASELKDPMMLGNELIYDKNLLFDDSVKHGFPKSSGRQISLRIFADFNYNDFKVIKIYEC